MKLRPIERRVIHFYMKGETAEQIGLRFKRSPQYAERILYLISVRSYARMQTLEPDRPEELNERIAALEALLEDE